MTSLDIDDACRRVSSWTKIRIGFNLQRLQSAYTMLRPANLQIRLRHSGVSSCDCATDLQQQRAGVDCISANDRHAPTTADGRAPDVLPA
jgi:hypothetical protein